MINHPGSETLESMSQAVWYNTWTLSKFKKYLKGNILEVGCGTGNFSNYLEKYGNLTAIDINKDYVEQAASKVRGAKVGVGDVEKGEYFFSSNGFDSIVCLNVLEHIKNDATALENIYKILKASGYLILLVPSHPLLYNSIDESIGHYRRYKRNDLQKIVEESGFEIVSLRTLNFLGGIGWFIAGMLKETKVSELKIKLFNLIAPFILLIENLIEPPFGTSLLIVAGKK